jgi:hypothetical protein
MPTRTSWFIRSTKVRIFLGILALVYLGYLATMASNLFPSNAAPSIVEHEENANTALEYWNSTYMNEAVDPDGQGSSDPSYAQAQNDPTRGKAAKQDGKPSQNKNLGADFPVTTVGKVFFSNAAGQNFVCSGTAVVSNNKSVVDTAGHCLYWNKQWMQNVIFCPLYDHGNSPYGCWAARDLEVPAEWIDAKPNNFHRDFGIAVVAPNSQGLLTDVVGGVGWAYNQPVDQSFYAYGYPAAYPYDGQSRVTCPPASGKSWQHGDGTVISIACGMTGGSSGGPWFIKINNKWYVNGHNDFINRLQPGQMFSPYYDDTWYAMYNKAQRE